jgi:hypothetical protein
MATEKRSEPKSYGSAYGALTDQNPNELFGKGKIEPDHRNRQVSELLTSNKVNVEHMFSAEYQPLVLCIEGRFYRIPQIALSSQSGSGTPTFRCVRLKR